MIEQLFRNLAALPQVEAIALGGSRAGEVFDEKSDYDVYLYCTGAVDEEVRRRILSQYCQRMEIGNHFWELEDNCTLNNGIDIDILYRNLDNFSADVAAVVEEGRAGNGYTTCMWHNIKTCKVIYDRDGRLQQVKERFDVPYPQHLKQSIIRRNCKLLYGTLPAYAGQIRKAAGRGDFVSVNHRTAAFLESYFDILFAVNEKTHPGEKRLIQLCKAECNILPKEFEENLNKLFGNLFTAPQNINDDLKRIVDELEKILPEIE